MGIMVFRKHVFVGLVLIFLVCLCGVCAGCNSYRFFPESYDVQRLMFARVLAIDSVDNGEKILLTLASRTVSGAANDPSKKLQAFSSEGRTFFEAERNFSNRVDKEIFLGHLDYIILGQEAAQLDLTEFLDALLRDPTIRKSTCLIVCTNMSAKDFVMKGSSEDAFPSERLDNLFLGERLLSQSSYTESIDSQHFFTRNSRIKTIDFLRDLGGLTRTAMIPCLSALPIEEQLQGEQDKPLTGDEDDGEVETDETDETDEADEAEGAEGVPEEMGKEQEEPDDESGGGDEGLRIPGEMSEDKSDGPGHGKKDGSQNVEGEGMVQQGNQLFALDGYAVYKDSLIGYLSGTQGRAANILLGRVFSGQLLVHGPDGNDVSLEILSCSRDFELDWDAKGSLKVHISVQMKTSITEYQGNDDIFTEESLSSLVAQQNKIIEKEIRDLLRFTREHRCDLAGFGKLFANKYPIRFRTLLASTWADDGYNRIEFTISVDSLIDHSRNLRRPLFSG
ncbi:MAG: hypothetical protein FWG40_07995 [Peptococcaceae bacterium]|nr:hypothetical protein [Peptococcaceae bacterium]